MYSMVYSTQTLKLNFPLSNQVHILTHIFSLCKVRRERPKLPLSLTTNEEKQLKRDSNIRFSSLVKTSDLIFECDFCWAAFTVPVIHQHLYNATGLCKITYISGHSKCGHSVEKIDQRN